MRKMLTISAYIIGAAFAFAFASTWVQIQREKIAEEKRVKAEISERNNAIPQMVAVCARKGLEAIDIEWPHTPKCLDFATGLMTVPKELFDARGGHL